MTPFGLQSSHARSTHVSPTTRQERDTMRDEQVEHNLHRTELDRIRTALDLINEKWQRIQRQILQEGRVSTKYHRELHGQSRELSRRI